MGEYQQYTKDRDYFYLIHELVSKIDMLKGFDASYNSKEVHNGIFRIRYEDEDYVVTVRKEDKVSNPVSTEHDKNGSIKYTYDSNNDPYKSIVAKSVIGKEDGNTYYPLKTVPTIDLDNDVDSLISALNGGNN